MDKPQLKYEDARLVECGNLDKFVNMHLEGFGASWRALDTGYDGFHNGSYVEAEVELGAVIEDDEDQSFARWLMGEGPFYLDEDDTYSYELPQIHHMLQWLCNIGEIPTGKYVVELWW
jgi:hypothetical protein